MSMHMWCLAADTTRTPWPCGLLRQCECSMGPLCDSFATAGRTSSALHRPADLGCGCVLACTWTCAYIFREVVATLDQIALASHHRHQISVATAVRDVHLHDSHSAARHELFSPVVSIDRTINRSLHLDPSHHHECRSRRRREVWSSSASNRTCINKTPDTAGLLRL